MLTEKRIKDLVKKHEPYLAVFEEYDRTGKLRKAAYKERVNFTIDESIMIRFRKYCQENGFNMSSKVEAMIKKELMNDHFMNERNTIPIKEAIEKIKKK